MCIRDRYKAWSSIVRLLIPNMDSIEHSLKEFCSICDFDEVVIFEKSTFLIIASYDNKPKKDVSKYERLSNIVKQFKLSCNRLGTEINGISVKNSQFTTVIQEFTENTYIMIVVSDPNIQMAAIDMNIGCAREFFKRNSKSEMENLLFNWGKDK
eukprot:TRINITY_DN7134_c0_g1_i5.p2 TRINITY_DN7134_c0_g1~~TRINITY_DN7134_c0_g1_i5.p2  ORF type:complete len:154 (-),score=21.82 TRINITY_DN7134_c0_g1_i5:143-604(-)